MIPQYMESPQDLFSLKKWLPYYYLENIFKKIYKYLLNNITIQRGFISTAQS